MPILTLTLQTLTPLITKGAANDARNDPAELRAASFRGMFRYWLRALLGARVQNDIDRLREYESHIFGSVERGSAVSIRTMGRAKSEDGQVVLPETVRGGIPHQFHAIPTGRQFRLILQSHPLGQIPAEAQAAMLLALRLGGVGRRARRGGGSLAIIRARYDGEDGSGVQEVGWLQRIPANFEQLCDLLRKDIERAQKPFAGLSPKRSFSGLPTYPVFDPQHVKVLVGPAQPDYQKALRAMWNIRKQQPYHDDPAFGGVHPRLQSPVHMRVALSGERLNERGNPAAYHPVMTIFRTNSVKNWGVMQDFVDACEQRGFKVIFGEGGWS